MAPFLHPLEGLLLRLTAAESRQQLLQELLAHTPALQELTLWSQDDRGRKPLWWTGERPGASDARLRRLSHESDYWLGAVPDLPIPAGILAVLELRLLYLDAQDMNLALNNQLAALTVAARTDALTRLPNRHAFEADLDIIDAAGTPFAVVFIDLDGFKGINDRFGHALGDSLLKGYARWLSRVTGPWGRVYRVGGDEYLLLMTRFPGSPEAFAVWAQERLQIPFVDGVSASIGIAWRHECAAVSDVVRLADQRMYQAKAVPQPPPGHSIKP